MEIEAFIKKMKDINTALLDFIEADDDSETEFSNFITIMDEYDILQNKEETQILFRSISKIADNHFRTSDFFEKLEKVFHYLIKEKPAPISNYIKKCKEFNKRALLLLLQKGFLKPDSQFLEVYINSIESFTGTFSKKKVNDIQRIFYLYPGMKQYIDENNQKMIENKILSTFDEEISSFEKKCQIGENDSYICSLIRNDLVDEFISYINRTSTSNSTIINPSIFETNSFLIDKQPTLIEYASFFGSIQIIQYLKYSNVPLTSSLWQYSVHSNNADLIHFLEENRIKPQNNDILGIVGHDRSYNCVLKECIKCHHNSITNYIKDNLLSRRQDDDWYELSFDFDTCILDSLNFIFFPDDIGSIISEMRNEEGFNILNLLFSQKVITIPSNMTSIGSQAFDKCSKLTQIIIPSSVKEIGMRAFSGCSSLTHLIIPSSVTSIKEYAFDGCSALKEITIPSSLTSIRNFTFQGCSSLARIIIPSFVASIGDYAFNGCHSLNEIIFPPSVERIGEYSFSDCSSLKQIEIHSSVKSIGNYSFYRCSSLEKVSILSKISSIGDGVFSSCTSLAFISIPESVDSIGKNSFYNCSSLTQIEVPSSVKSIGNYAFYGCSSLAHISFPPLIKSIGSYAFYGCTLLTEECVPSSVTSVGNNAFSKDLLSK